MVDMPAGGGSYIRDPATGALTVVPLDTSVSLPPTPAAPAPASPVTTDAPASEPAAKSGA